MYGSVWLILKQHSRLIFPKSTPGFLTSRPWLMWSLHLACHPPPPPAQAGWTFFTILQPKLNKIIESVSPHAWHIAGVPSRESCNASAEVVPTSPACLQGWLSTWPADLGTCPSQADHRQMKLPVKKAILCRPHTGHLIHVPSVLPLLQDKGSTPPEPQGWVRQGDGVEGSGVCTWTE